jgi:hypothetical protein
MSESSKSRLRFAAVALLMLVLIASALGGAWHHHKGAFDANCCLCHVSHQAFEPSLAVSSQPVLAVLKGRHQEPAAPPFLTQPVARRLPARAPPIA